jgi:hypothetical protein
MEVLPMKILLALLACAAPLFADCTGGSRPATAAEKQFHTAILQRLKAQVPPAPAGWAAGEPMLESTPTHICGGADPAQAEMRVSYSWQEGLKERGGREMDLSQQAEAIRKMPADKQAQLDELRKQASSLSREAQKARAAGNKAEMDRLNAEVKAVNAKSAAIRREHEAAILPALMKLGQGYVAVEENKRYSVEVNYRVNGNAPPAGGVTKDGVRIIRAPRESFIIVEAAAKPGLAVRYLNIRMFGDPAHIDKLLAGWDLASLKQIVR